MIGVKKLQLGVSGESLTVEERRSLGLSCFYPPFLPLNSVKLAFTAKGCVPPLMGAPASPW